MGKSMSAKVMSGLIRAIPKYTAEQSERRIRDALVKGEKPVKANGKLYVIDGGLSKAYHRRTGIAGYTLIFNSHHLALAEHTEYDRKGDNTPKMYVTEMLPRRLLVRDTDIGEELKKRIFDLEELIECYRIGLIKEHERGEY